MKRITSFILVLGVVIVTASATSFAQNLTGQPKGDTMVFDHGCEFTHDPANPQVLKVKALGGMRIDVRMDEMQATAATGPHEIPQAATATGTGGE